MSGITICVRGTFAVADDAGRDLTPSGQKEKALLALLAYAPDGRRSRKWLQEMLWSDRYPEQASGSLRRAVYNIRNHLNGAGKALLAGDRSGVALISQVTLDDHSQIGRDLLEDIDVADPAYQDWLRELRYTKDGKVTCNRPNAPRPISEKAVRIVCSVPQENQEARFLARFFVDELAMHLRTYGSIGVEFIDNGPEGADGDGGAVLSAEMECAILEGEWYTHLRVFEGSPRRFLWSGRLRLPMDLQAICDGPQVANFIGRAITAMRTKISQRQGNLPYFAIQDAAAKVFLGDRDELELAERILDQMGAQDAAGVAKAWRGYIRLTRALEFGENGGGLTGEAVELMNQALRQSDENALVMALASQIHLKLCADYEAGAYFARKAVEYSDTNPYALHSLSQAKGFARDFESAFKLALAGKQASDALTNAYCWDMQCCLSALGLGKRAEALKFAREAHLKMPNYRPALRYLLSLSLIEGQREQAVEYARRLGRIEPGFTPGRLLEADYPVDTLRMLGLDHELAAVLTL
jgi:tetratricopeptide (TPR) repeat protein